MSGVQRFLYIMCAVFSLAWPLAGASQTKIPEGPTGHPNCTDARDNNLSSLRDGADTGCASAMPFADCSTGHCAEAGDGLLVSPLEPVSDEDTDGTVNVVALPFGQTYTAAKVCYGVDFDFTGYLWLRVKGEGAFWATINGDAGHNGTPDNRFLTKVNQIEYAFVPMGLRSDKDFNREPNETDAVQRQFVMTGATTPIHLCIAMSGGLSLRSIFLHTSATATPVLPAVIVVPEPVADYQMFELGANPDPTVDAAIWLRANVAALNGQSQNLPLAAPASMRAIWKAGTPSRIFVRWEKDLASQAWLDVATDSTTIASYVASIFYVKMDSLARALNENTWILAGSPQPDYYDANWPAGTFTLASNLSNLTVTSSLLTNRRRIQFAFDAPVVMTEGQQFLCGFRDNERVTAGVLRWQYAFNVDVTLGHLGLCQAAGEIVTPADVTNPTVLSTVVNCATPTSCTVTVAANDAVSGSMISTVQYGTATGVYTASNGPIATVGNCTVSCTALHTITGLTAATQYFALATVQDQAGNTDAGSEANDTTGAAGITRWIAAGASGTTCTEGSPCPISRLGATSGTYPAPGEAWLLKNGNYPVGTVINCAAGSRNGTTSQKITVRAENERQAVISANASTLAFLRILNCADWNIEGITFLASITNTNTKGKFECSGCARIGFRRNLLVHGARQATGSPLLTIPASVIFWNGTGGHVVEENECYGDVRYCQVSKYESGTIYRRNYANNRGYKTPENFLATDNNDDKMDAAISIYPGSNNTVEDNISENNSTALNNESGNSMSSSNNKSFGNISLNDWYGQKMAPHAGTLVSNWIIRDLLVINASKVPLSAQSNINTVISHFSLFPTSAATAGIVASITSGVDPANLSIYARDGLVYGTAGKKGATVQLGGVYDDFDFDRLRLFNNTGTTPTSDARITNITTSDPGMGTARVCIPTTSNLKGAASDGGDIGASVLYRYQSGVKSATLKRWITTKPASCPANTSGIYPYGMGACVSGLNDSVSTSLVGIADRLGMTITQVETTCGAGAGYFP